MSKNNKGDGHGHGRKNQICIPNFSSSSEEDNSLEQITKSVNIKSLSPPPINKLKNPFVKMNVGSSASSSHSTRTSASSTAGMLNISTKFENSSSKSKTITKSRFQEQRQDVKFHQVQVKVQENEGVAMQSIISQIETGLQNRLNRKREYFTQIFNEGYESSQVDPMNSLKSNFENIQKKKRTDLEVPFQEFSKRIEGRLQQMENLQSINSDRTEKMSKMFTSIKKTQEQITQEITVISNDLKKFTENYASNFKKLEEEGQKSLETYVEDSKIAFDEFQKKILDEVQKQETDNVMKSFYHK